MFSFINSLGVWEVQKRDYRPININHHIGSVKRITLKVQSSKPDDRSTIISSLESTRPTVAAATLNTFAVHHVFNPDPNGLTPFLFPFVLILLPELADSLLDTLHQFGEKAKDYNI